MMRRSWLAGAVAALLLCACGPTSQGTVSFETTGGDAWTFHKRLEARASCDQVTFATPTSRVIATVTNGRAVARIDLHEGANVVTAACAEGAPAARQQWRVRIADVPKAVARATVDRSAILLDGRASTMAEGEPARLLTYEWRARAGDPPLAGLPARGAQVNLAAPAADGEYGVILRVTDAKGRSDESTVILARHGQALAPVDAIAAPPSWTESAVVYGVVPPLFGTHGFADVQAHLDELKRLGVNTLWISPVTDASPGDFGYAVTDHFELRTNFGDEAAWRKLIAAAHQRGFKVIVDFVSNHLAEDHPYVRDAKAHGPASPYFNFLDRTQDGAVRSYFNWANLKNLDYDNAEVQRMMIEAFKHWVRAYGVDGFRVDAAWGPRTRAPEFWPQMRAELKRINPDVFLLAEASARDPYYGSNTFDAAYDWTDALGEWSWRKAFDDAPHTAALLKDAITKSLANEGNVFRFLDNNDTGARFITRYGLARTKVSAALLMTLPGIPELFTGDEVGAAFEPYKDNHPLAWDDPQGLFAYYQRLIALRAEHANLRSRRIRFIDTGNAQVLGFRRKGPDQDDILVLLNFGATAATVRLGKTSAHFDDLLTGETLSAREAARLPANGARILVRAPRSIPALSVTLKKHRPAPRDATR